MRSIKECSNWPNFKNGRGVALLPATIEEEVDIDESGCSNGNGGTIRGFGSASVLLRAVR
jgi:hypothetical protein